MRTPESVSCRYAVTPAIFSRVSRYAPLEVSRKTTLAHEQDGKVRNVIEREAGIEHDEDHRDAEQRQRRGEQRCMPSVTSWSSACTSLVRREISTPALLRE